MSPDTEKTPLSPYNPRIGLALGSGMARGLAHIGILKVLKKNNIKPSVIAGTSIGALVGGAYLAGKLDILEDWARHLTRRRIFTYLDFRVRSAGLIGGERLAALLQEHFSDLAIEDLPIPLIAVASDLSTGHEIWLREGRMVDAMRASFALPGVFPPVEMDRRLLVDGALVNPVPIAPLLAAGARMTMAVDLHSDMLGKAAKPGRNYQTIMGFDVFSDAVAPEDQRKFSGSLTRRLFRRDPSGPSLFGVMVSALGIIQDRLTRSRLAGDPPDVHIRPRVGHIGLLEFEKAPELIDEGEAAAERALPHIKAAMDVLVPHS